MQNESLKSVNFNGQLTDIGQMGAKRSAFQTLGCILPKKIVWDQIEKAPNIRGAKCQSLFIISTCEVVNFQNFNLHIRSQKWTSLVC